MQEKLEQDALEKLKNLIIQVNRNDLSTNNYPFDMIYYQAHNPDTTSADFKKLLNYDIPLAARILKLANSHVYGGRYKMDKIRQTFVWMGKEKIVELIDSQKKIETDSKILESSAGFSRSGLWKHSFTVATLASKIFLEELGERKADNIFAAGLLHDIGVIIIEQFLYDDFLNILHERMSNGTSLVDAEKKILGFTHTDIGKALAWDWGYPETLVSSLGFHHTPQNSNEKFRKFAEVIFIADFICQKEELNFVNESQINESTIETCLNNLNLEIGNIEKLYENSKNEVFELVDDGWFG